MKKILRPLVVCLLTAAILGCSDSSTYSSLRDSISVLMAAVTGREPVLTSDEDLARKVAPAVVRLSVLYVKNMGSEEVVMGGVGAAWAIDDHLLVTAQHVIEDAYIALRDKSCKTPIAGTEKCAQILAYTFDGRTVEADIEQSNAKATIRVSTQFPPPAPPYDLDMSLLRLASTDVSGQPFKMAQKLAIAPDDEVGGNHVITVGHPGLMLGKTGGWTVTVGRPALVCPNIDGFNIQINQLKGADAERYFVIDADSGNSGGPIVDSRGYVVGMLAGGTLMRSTTACSPPETKIAPEVILTLLGTASSTAYGGPKAQAMQAQIQQWAPPNFKNDASPAKYVPAPWTLGDDTLNNELTFTEMMSLRSILKKSRSSTLEVLQDIDGDGPFAPINTATAVMIAPGRALTASHVANSLMALPPGGQVLLRNMAGQSVRVTGVAASSMADQFAGIDLALLTYEDADGQKMSASLTTSLGNSDPTVNDVVLTVGHPGITTTGLGLYVATAGRHLGWGIQSSTSDSIVDNQNQFSSSVPAQPGNSGGPVFDARGNLIGLISHGRTQAESSNIPPFLKVRQFLPALIDNKREGSVSQMVARSSIKTFLANPPATVPLP